MNTNGLVFAAFCLLLLVTYFQNEGLNYFRKRQVADWILDASGLLMQGIAVPLLQTTVLYLLLAELFPGAKGMLSISPVAAFLLNFVAVDYLYYWNHRLLHGSALWPWHAVHHTAENLDVIVTSRNSVWSHFLVVYVWINSLLIFLLAEPAPYILAASITAALDLWRHSKVYPSQPNRIYELFGLFLVTPFHHAWHHSRENVRCNFGANLNLWDRLHGTYSRPNFYPAKLGIVLDETLTQKLFSPVKPG